MDEVAINNVKKVAANAKDDTDIIGVVGGIQGSSKAAIGAGVVYTEIGGVSTDKKDAKQLVTAEITNSTINSAGSGSEIAAKAADDARVINVAVGIGGSGKASVEGSASTVVINKNTTAQIEKTDIDKDDADSDKATVNVTADNTSEITSNASVIAGSGKASAGAGVSVNRIIQQTNAAVNGGTMRVSDLTVKSDAKPRIENIGIGGSVAGTAGVTGSVAVNTIQNDAAAYIGSGADIVARGNVGVVAQSDEQIANYAGTLAGGGKVGVGVSVSVNTITGTTEAGIGSAGEDKTKVVAKGQKGDLKTNTKVTNDQMYEGWASDESTAMDKHIQRSEETHKGILVDASSTRDMKSFLVNAGAGANAGVAATVNVNNINGETKAVVTNAMLNNGAASGSEAGDVTVKAGDYTNSAGLVGSLAAAIQGAGVGMGSDTNVVNRKTEAIINSSDIKAKDLDVTAISKQAVSSFVTSAGVAGEGAGVAGIVTVAQLSNTTKAQLADSKVTANSLGVDSDHYAAVYAGNIGVGAGIIGAGVGLSVGVLKDNSVTEANVGNSEAKDKDENTITVNGDVDVKANNLTKTEPSISATGAGAVGVGGTTSVNNLNSRVRTNISNVKITSNTGSIKADAKNKYETDAYVGSNGAGGLGVGVSVSVNTIDSTVQTNVDNSDLTAAKDIELTASEEREITQLVTNVAAGPAGGIGANIAVTNVGKKVDGDAATAVDKANKEYGNFNVDQYTYGQTTGTQPTMGAEFGGDKDSQITVNVTGGKLTAGNKVTAKAEEKDDITMTAGSGAAGMAAFNAGVGILNINRNVGVNVSGADIKADKIDLSSSVSGTTKMNMYQGAVAMLSGNASIGKVSTEGFSRVNINGGSFTAHDIDVLASDSGKATINSLGITVGLVSAGVITAEAQNDSNVTVDVTGAEFITQSKQVEKEVTKTDDKGKEVKVKEQVTEAGSVDIDAEKATDVEAHATGGSGGLLSGSGVVATAKDSGNAAVNINAGNTFKADTANGPADVNALDVQAANRSSAKAIADSVAVSLVGGGNAAVATAENIGAAKVTVTGGNKLLADVVNLNAVTGSDSAEEKSAEAKAEGNSGSAGYNVGVNNATATSNMTADVRVNSDNKGIDYKTKTEKTYTHSTWDETGKKETKHYDEKIVGVTSLNVQTNNISTAAADARGVTIGGVFASGNNKAVVNNTANTNISVNGGSSADSLLGDLNVTASGTTDSYVTGDGSGGATVDAGLAAYVKNTTVSRNTINIGGKFNVTDGVNINAMQGDTANLNADSLKVAAVSLSAVKAENSISGDTTVTLSNADITAGGDVAVNAMNNVTVGDKEKYAVEGAGYAGGSVQGALYDNTVKKNAAINVTGSDINSDGAQTMEAKTDGNINAAGYIKAGGLVAVTWADINNTVDSNNTVTIDKDSQLKSHKGGKDITIAAVDNMDIIARGVADTQIGLGGGASSDVSNNLTRNNKVTVDGDLYGMRDVNLYAGKDKNGNYADLNLVVEAEAYNKTAIGIAKPKFSDAVNQNNQVTVNSGADVSSVRNINLYADAGKEVIRETSVKYNWYNSDKDENYASSSIGTKTLKSQSSDNYVKVDGKLTAGIQNKQYITIGKDGQLVFLDPATLEAVKKYGKGQENAAVDENDVYIDASSSVDTDSIKFGTLDYGKELFERYTELRELQSAYSEEKDSTAYLGYKAEADRIYSQMQTLGLVQDIYDDNGKVIGSEAVEGMTFDYIELPDIVASGGNINIQSDNFIGKGELEAKGGPEVIVNNNTNLYMKVNNIEVGQIGGEITFNNTDLSSSNYKDKITELNSEKYKNDVAFKNIHVDKGDSENNGKIIINSNYNAGEIYAKITVDGKEQIIQTLPKSGIEINGDVVSEEGSVEITNKSNDIIIQGKTANTSASVKGKEVHLTAAGSISQGYTNGITSIGGDVQTQYKDEYDAAKKYFNDKYGYEHKENVSSEKWYGSQEVKKGSNNQIAGENIYINAADININGEIQSGFADYQLIIDAKVQDRIDELQSNWDKNPESKQLSDSMVMNDAYRITIGGVNKKDSTIYNVEAYYNPSTGKIVVPDIDAKGGQVYLTGRISSTGNGSIKVLDGAYDINVQNDTKTDLQLGKLVSNNVEGLISITDSNKKQVTEIRRNGTTVKGLDGSVISTGASRDTYSPEEDLRYNWTTGQNVTTTKKYEKTQKAGLWGAVETLNETQMKDYEQKWGTSEPPSEDKTNKKNGEYIGKVNGVDNDKQFVVIYDNKVLVDSRTDPKKKTWSTGFLNWFKWKQFSWETKTGTTQQYVGSVKADHDIKLGFFGNADGSSKINVNSTGNIDLMGKVAATDNDKSKIDIITGGAITQYGNTINGDNVNLQAVAGMNNIDITSYGDTVNLNAVNTGMGDVNINVNNAYGKLGDVVLDKLSTKQGSVALNAVGSITQNGTDTSVSADRIDLVSRSGSIGTAQQALVVHGGQVVTNALDSLSASVNANAKSNIYLTQDEGDMRLGRVYSDNGDVTINVSGGNLIDALPTGETVDRGNTEALIQKWKDLGLIEGDGEYRKQQEQDVADYKAGVADEFAGYNELKKYYTDEKNQFNAEEKAAYEKFAAAKDQFDNLAAQYKEYENAKVYYGEDNKPKRENFTSDKAYQNALNQYNEGKAKFDELSVSCSGYTNVLDYAKATMGDDYNDYDNPVVGSGENAANMKQSFANYAQYTELSNRYGAYESADAYLAGSEAKKHIADLTKAGAGWDQNQLLYAIQDTIINPDSGATDAIVKDPNLKGNNITLNVKGSVGLNSEETTVIELAGLGSRVEDLKKLASADASTVVWDAEGGKATINQKNPLGIQMNAGGKLHVNASENVFLTGRTVNNDASVVNKINIEQVYSDGRGNIRIQGQDGIYNVRTDDDAAIKGGNLLIQAGKGDIGALEKNMNVDLTGTLQAQAQGNIIINQVTENPLEIFSVGAGKDIVLKAAGDIVSGGSMLVEPDPDEEETVAQGYIRSDNGTINIEAGGSAGTKENELRIKNAADDKSGQVVNVTAGKDINITGVSAASGADPQPEGTMFLGNIKANGNVSFDVAGNIAASGDIVNEAADGSVNLDANLAVNLKSGTLTAENTNIAGTKVTQSAEHKLDVDTLTVEAAEGIDLISVLNQLNNVTVQNTGSGSINLVNNGAEDLNVVVKGNDETGKVDGDVTITNGRADTTVKSNVTLQSDINAAGNVTVTNNNGAINAGENITAGENVALNTTTGAINVTGSVNAGDNAQLTTGSGAINLGGSVEATTGKVEVKATGDNGTINTKGTVTAGTDVTMNTAGANGSITTGGAITAGNDVKVQATGENSAISLGGDVLAKAGEILANTNTGDITVKGNANANTNVGFTSGSGNINVVGDVIATTGKVTVNTGSGDIGVTGNVSAKEEAEFTVQKNGDITLGGTTKAEDINAKVTGNGSISFTGSVTSTGGNVSANVGGKGNIETGKDAAVEAAKDISFTTNNGSITTNSSLNAGNNFTANTNTGDILFNGNVSAQQNINVNVTEKGTIKTSDGEVDGHTGAKLEAINGNMTIKNEFGDIDMHELYAKNALDIIAEKGNINICDINGNIVTIVLKTPGTKQHVDHITAGSQIVLEGSDINLDEIDRRVGSDGMLIISPKGNDDQPMNEFNIGSINSAGGIRLDQLWAKNSKINVLDGRFYIDKLFIENEAHFSRGDFTTAVYGKAPVDDGSNSIFWNNPKYNPAYNLNAWKAEGQNGFYFLNFEEHPYVQRSNMVLVHLDDYYYVYNQRFTGVNHARYLEGDGLYELHQLADEPTLLYYNRYYNYDLPEMAQNADEDELVIESENV